MRRERRIEAAPVVNWARSLCELIDLACHPALFAAVALEIDPDSHQMALLGTESRRVILNCCRQWGKSTMTAAKAVHRSLFQPGALTVCISPSGRQSMEFVRKVRALARRAGQKVTGDGENRASVVFANGSRVVGLPSKDDTTRGFSKASLLIVDEASRVKDDHFVGMLPMISTGGGDLWLLSTPNGRTGFFWRTWDKAQGWFRMKATAEECPRTSKEVLEEHRMMFTDRQFRQEYLCEFLDSDDALFNMDQVDRLFNDAFTDLNV